MVVKFSLQNKEPIISEMGTLSNSLREQNQQRYNEEISMSSLNSLFGQVSFIPHIWIFKISNINESLYNHSTLKWGKLKLRVLCSFDLLIVRNRNAEIIFQNLKVNLTKYYMLLSLVIFAHLILVIIKNYVLYYFFLYYLTLKWNSKNPHHSVNHANDAFSRKIQY